MIFKKRIRFIFLYYLFFISSFSNAQNPVEQKRTEDSVLTLLKSQQDEKVICKNYLFLAEQFIAADKEKEALYLNKALFASEQTRDRQFIAKTCLDVVNRYIDMGGIQERYEKAIIVADRGINVAKEAQLHKLSALLTIKKAIAMRSIGKHTEAIKANADAVNFAELANSDSLKCIAELSYANTLAAKDQDFEAFRKYMLSLNLAEELDNNNLKKVIYSNLADFYTKIDQYEKAKDYYQKCLQIAKKEKDENYEIVIYNSLLTIYSQEKNFTGAREYLQLIKNKADTSKNDFLRTRALLAEVNLLFTEDISKVGAYLRKNPKINSDLRQWGYDSEADKAMGIMYSLENKKDSAEFYFKKSFDIMSKSSTPFSLVNLKMAYAGHLERLGNYKEAIRYLEENLATSRMLQSLTLEEAMLTNLDSLYIKAGDKSKEINNKLVLYKIKDSLEKQQKQKDFLNVEIDAENKRNERIAAAKAEKLRQKHNLQYMGITAGILALFILLAGLGHLRVKPIIIRAIGFISFILLFEFIILLIDKPLHHFTHGEPLPLLLIKIVIIAILLPLHHWLEHKVIHYLMQHRHKTSS